MTTDNAQTEIEGVPEQPAMLTNIEARVLGALMEKQLTTPDAYPLTLNSLILACNQKTSREPLTNLTSGDVQRCLNQLRERELIEVDYGSRADRYDQRLSRKLGLSDSVRKVLTIMLLRGPQTANELLTRTQRMVEFSSLQEVEELLHHQEQKTKPLIFRIPRQSGQREDRFAHLLCGEPDLSTLSTKTSSAASSSRKDVEARIEKLEQQVAKLMALSGVSDKDC